MLGNKKKKSAVEVETFNDNQSLFEQHEPLREGVYRPEAPIDPNTVEEESVPWYKQKRFMIGGFVATVAVTLMFIAVVMMTAPPMTPPTEEMIEETPVTEMELTELEARYQEVLQTHQAADPTLLELGMPPLDYVFTLETDQRLRN